MPFLFNPLKHHLGFIREFIYHKTKDESIIDIENLIKELRHLGRSVMDIYNGSLLIKKICKEIKDYLDLKGLSERDSFSKWTVINTNDFRIITLSDNSQWTLKYQNSENRYVHFFPARSGQHTFRVKANTLKSALLYQIIIGKDYISVDDLNKGRSLLGLSPVKNSLDIEAILQMIEILRD